MLLGDLGAEVIKVERPGEGDDTRAFAPPFQGDQAAYFLSINRNKKSITLDMKSERGKEVLWRRNEFNVPWVGFRHSTDSQGLGPRECL
jgi:crotonobetainyl-CoA:carnitine CoA-transferase CaiB-like acyl-CoA transferase